MNWSHDIALRVSLRVYISARIGSLQRSFRFCLSKVG